MKKNTNTKKPEQRTVPATIIPHNWFFDTSNQLKRILNGSHP